MFVFFSSLIFIIHKESITSILLNSIESKEITKMKKKKKKESYARQIYNNTCILSQCSSIKSNGQSLLNLVSRNRRSRSRGNPLLFLSSKK